MRSPYPPPLLHPLLCLLALALPALAESPRIPEPDPRDTCPVCGMFVAKYPEWIAAVQFRDGEARYFDGAKDLLKYLLDLSKWAPGRQADDIAAIEATEYYGLTHIDAREAWYVVGSDVLGPMGHELVPLATREDADEFLRDHAGKRLLRFDEATLELLRDLDSGSPTGRDAR